MCPVPKFWSLQVGIDRTPVQTKVITVQDEKRNIIRKVIVTDIQHDDAVLHYVSRIEAWLLNKCRKTIARN